MKCPEAEKKIYVYRELPLVEREQLEEHLEACPSCAQTMERVTNLQGLIASSMAKVPSIENEAQMTHRIMDAVLRLQKSKFTWREEVLRSLHASALRYSMVALSLMFVIFFFAEYADGEKFQTADKVYPHDPGNSSELKLASFHTAFFSAKDGRRQASTLISECVARCLRSRQKGCTQCLDRFAKQ